MDSSTDHVSKAHVPGYYLVMLWEALAPPLQEEFLRGDNLPVLQVLL